MASLMKTGIGVGAAVVLIGVWVAVKSFSGAKIGEECHAGSDTDCKGWSAQCLTSQSGSYCSSECKVDKDCPADWACGAIGVTIIDAKGNTKKRDSDLRMCHKGGRASASASASASSAPAAPAASAPPPAAPAASTAAVASVAPAAPKAPAGAKPKPKK